MVYTMTRSSSSVIQKHATNKVNAMSMLLICNKSFCVKQSEKKTIIRNTFIQITVELLLSKI